MTGGTVGLSAAQAHYLGNVLRLGAGACVKLFNGRDGEFLARIASVGRGAASVAVEDCLRGQAAGPDLWLVFCPLKRDFTDLVVRTATELGVSAIRPVFSARTNVGRVNVERLSAIAVEAAEQSERLTVPEISPPTPLADLLGAWPTERLMAAAIERTGPAPVPEHAGALLVGPEGGFSQAELDALRGARFVAPICLGPRVLRAETAAIAGLALLQGRAWSTN